MNIDLHHQYGISVAESQRLLVLAERPKRQVARIKGYFSEANTPPTNSIYPAT